MGPRAELRRVQDELFDARKERRDRGAIRSDFVELVTGQLEERADEPERPVVQRDDPPADTDDPFAALQAERDRVEVDRVDDDLARDDDLSREEALETLETARDTMAVRLRQARAALWEDVDPTPQQEQVFDAVIDDMNDRLSTLAEDLIDEVVANGEPGRRESMGFAADALDIFLSAEDAMMNAMTAEQREVVREEATDATAFVDPDIVDILIQLDGLAEP
jgi:hypothetical protein